MYTLELERIAGVVPPYHESRLKALLERATAAVGLVLVSPLLLVLMALVRLESAGSPLLRQRRVGRNGEAFTMFKLRSMYADAEKNGAQWAAKKDPRVTNLGRILRKLHLDELPQLANIAAGQMSFVGPRPERPEFVFDLAQTLPGYTHRLAVKPGVTGLAQVNLAPDQTVDCVRRKLELDLQYIFTSSWGVDARIAACTLLKMACVPRQLAAKSLGLYCEPTEYRPAEPMDVTPLSTRVPTTALSAVGRTMRDAVTA